MKQEEKKKAALEYHVNLTKSFIARMKEAAQEDEDAIIDAYGTEVMDIQKAFIAGAKWEKNRAWHYTTDELPEINKHVVNGDWFDFVAKDENDLKRIMKQYPFSRWAYVEDLLPDEED